MMTAFMPASVPAARLITDVRHGNHPKTDVIMTKAHFRAETVGGMTVYNLITTTASS
jgi:hypothetical protein